MHAWVLVTYLIGNHMTVKFFSPDLDISRFVPLGFELMAIGIKANKFSILYIHVVNKRYDKTEHKNQQL
jgi:hypothetical protein